MNIREHLGLRAPKVYNSGYGESKMAAPNLIVGLELEIENFDPDANREFSGVTFTEDGSLRGSDDGIGIEVITMPIKAKHLASLLGTFYECYDIDESNYTERCSTHVHMNVQDMTYEQLAVLCLLYQTVETLLFAYAGKERQDGIFCVPWNQCGISYSIVEKLEDFSKGVKNPLRQWQKYSALNLIPIGSQGSVEFRHLEGTCDVARILGWVNILSRMYNYAMEHSLSQVQQEIISMNTVSNYREWMDRVFMDHADLLRIPGFERELAAGVVDSKLALIKENKPKYDIPDLHQLLRELETQNRIIPGQTVTTTATTEGSF